MDLNNPKIKEKREGWEWNRGCRRKSRGADGVAGDGGGGER